MNECIPDRCMKTPGQRIPFEFLPLQVTSKGNFGPSHTQDVRAMFCTNCGEKATGRFCAYCGTPIVSTWLPDNGSDLDSRPASFSDTGSDWQDECRYQVLIHFPEVRDLIAKHGPPIHKGLTGEDILKICDVFTKPLTGLPIPMSKLTCTCS